MPKPSLVPLAVLAVPALTFGAFQLFLAHWVDWSAPALKDVSVYSSELGAAYGRDGYEAARPLATIDQGEPVSVIWHTYGKDYWACLVRTGSGERGWVLCTDLGPRLANGRRTS